MRLAIIGHGEAARSFIDGGLDAATAFDIDPAKRTGISCIDDPATAFGHATIILSLVTADQAHASAKSYASLLPAHALYIDMNSVSPDTKRSAAQLIIDAGCRYLDVAIMAPVHPAGLGVSLLVSGHDVAAGVATLKALGFTNVRAVGDEVGRASSIKMIRSVMVKGVEALTAEMMLAAKLADVESDVLASLGDGWDQKAAYNLARMSAHGTRRAREMQEVAMTLTALGVEPVMTRGTIVRQQQMAS